MTLRVIREPSINGATLGVVFLNDRFLCFSLEDELRERAGEAVESWKVPGQTAIPAGRYQLRVTWSPRFQRNLPELVDVPGFSGIRIHSGNRHSDTEGCLLVGFQRANAVVTESLRAMAFITPQIQAADKRGEEAWIEIENPPSWQAVNR
jgi:hypothetical protein